MSEMTKTAFVRVNGVMVNLVNAIAKGSKEDIILMSEKVQEAVDEFVDAAYLDKGVTEADLVAYVDRQNTIIQTGMSEGFVKTGESDNDAFEKSC